MSQTQATLTPLIKNRQRDVDGSESGLCFILYIRID